MSKDANSIKNVQDKPNGFLSQRVRLNSVACLHSQVSGRSSSVAETRYQFSISTKVKSAKDIEFDQW